MYMIVLSLLYLASVHKEWENVLFVFSSHHKKWGKNTELVAERTDKLSFNGRRTQ